jgi:hypothetical protein
MLALVLVSLLARHATPALADCSPDRLLSAPASFAAGFGAHDVVIGDFDTDGIPDLAVANPGDNTVSLHFGRGNGTFAPALPVPAIGPGPYGLAVCDCNKDGHLDLAVANSTGGTMMILLGDGLGDFAAPRAFPAGGGPFRLLSADFNGDGILDFAVVDNASGGVSVLLGNGSGGVWNGTLGAPTFYATGNAPSGVASADFNGDGIPDLAVSNYNDNNVRLLFGAGGGAFTVAGALATDIHPFCLIEGDVNADGIADLVTSNSQSNDVTVLLGLGGGGAGNGTFAPGAQYGAGGSPSVLTALDANGDGALDLAVANASSNDVSLLLGRTTGGFPNGQFRSVGRFPAGTYPIGIASADLNADGRPDVVTANFYDNDVAVLLGECIGTPTPTISRVRDVPGDQGGQVFVTWLASPLDNPIDRAITSYRVWRRIPDSALLHGAPGSAPAFRIPIRGEVRPLRADGATDVTYWEAIATLPAERLAGYGYTAATFEDSTRHHVPYVAFFVSALTADPTVFYESAVDSGYSVDNLNPHKPNNFVAVAAGNGVALHWLPADDPDVAQYVLYRGSTASFDPGPETQVAAVNDTGYVDAPGTTDRYYKVETVDAHGNTSDAAEAVVAGVLDVPTMGSQEFALRPVRPNPARGDRLAVEFALPRAGAVKIELVDIAGRSIERRDLGILSAGRHETQIVPAANLASGVYLLRLAQGANTVSRRVTIVN